MGEICRLCCSTKFVNNNIFDEESALYVKMSLYLPIKVFSEDKLPQKICDKCSCKVNDFYQFCSEAIEVESRLRSLLLIKNNLTNESVDLTVVKGSTSPPPPNLKISLHKSTQTESILDFTYSIQVKEEPKPAPISPIKEESTFSDSVDAAEAPSSDSEDVSLIKLKKKKPKKLPVNGEVKKTRKKKDGNIEKWKMLMSALPAGTELSVVEDPAVALDVVKVEAEAEADDNSQKEVDLYQCCICFAKCYRKSEMLQHYRKHASEPASSEPAAAPPPPPDQDPLRCTRCRKVVSGAEWGPHWARHWARDRRPYRCALCERAFRDPHQILKHGLTHNFEEGVEPDSVDKRFVCDLCPEAFVYMRYLLSHRTRAHPEAAWRQLALRCGVCARHFAHINSLRRHLRAHSGERNFLCNVCGKALSSREHLKFHIRIHTGYKPNVCKTCGKGFVKKCNLTLHERVHSGEKPHVCSHCGKAFSQRSTLVIHERYHSGARPYVCALCGRGFVAKGLLSMHLKTTCI